MKIQEVKAKYRMQEMQKMIRARTERGLTVSEWCQENNFSEGSYYDVIPCFINQSFMSSIRASE